jgi:hypothetical protein
MGIYECVNCGEVMDGESFWCEGCGFGEGDGNILCDGCATEGSCGKCGKSICVYCAESGEFSCCSMMLCGGEDEGEDTCAGKHRVKTLKCGHDSCNYNDGDCKSCPKEAKEKNENDAVEMDKALIKSMIEKASSDSFKQHLQEFLNDPTNKKRKLEEGRVGELESSLKRARNACSACRCGRANYY